MRELLNILPYLDIIIVVLLLFFLYVGWNGGVPRLLMVIGAIYTGFLLAAVYYHLLAVTLAGVFNIKSQFVADLLSFLVLDVLVTVVMLALLLSLFGHIEIRGRVAVFDKLSGIVLGFVAGLIVISILVTLLRVPYEANKYSLNAANDMPSVQLFNQAYEKSALAPYFIQAAPLLMSSVTPLLPDTVQQRGAVPLLQSIASQQR
jgi:uncharacterized membrane protein required for colicin V production